MVRFKILIVVFGLTLCSAVKINMQGSVSLGKEVLETISHYMRKNAATMMSRRAMVAVDDSERIKWTVQSANVCRGMKICNGPLGDFVKDYLVLIASAIESIFDGILDPKEGKDKSLFTEQLKPILYSINDQLKKSNDKIEVENDDFEWVTILKKISAKFQKSIINFVKDRLDGDPQDIQSIKKKLTQKLIIAIIIIENKYENKLCKEHKICMKEFEVSKGLQNMLEEISNVQTDKSMEFLKYFYENIPENTFYFLGSDTMHEFQVILSDLSYTNGSPAKDVLMSVLKIVQERLKSLKDEGEVLKAFDYQLINVILSDMDYFYYSKRKSYPFDNFLGPFTGWLRLGGKFSTHIKQLMKDLKKKMAEQSPELVEKLANEVRVFLELTVDVE